MNIDIIGDIHGCFAEFRQLTEKMGYTWKTGFPVHPSGRILGFVGDLTDRGPNSLQVIEVVHELVINQNIARYAPG
ncbi:metallophosphoesterase, partial [Peribacillus sp. NPDC058002]